MNSQHHRDELRVNTWQEHYNWYKTIAIWYKCQQWKINRTECNQNRL